MKLSDINVSILEQLDPSVAKAVVEAQRSAALADSFTTAVVGVAMAIFMIYLIKNT